jgi:hypothetical protein
MPRFGTSLERIRRSSDKEVVAVTTEEMKALFVANGISSEKADMQVVVCKAMGSNVLIGDKFYSLK